MFKSQAQQALDAFDEKVKRADSRLSSIFQDKFDLLGHGKLWRPALNTDLPSEYTPIPPLSIKPVDRQKTAARVMSSSYPYPSRGPLLRALGDGFPLQLPFRTGMKPLSPEEYKVAAETLGCDPLAIQAVGEQEGYGEGFYLGYTRILFQPAKFANHAGTHAAEKYRKACPGSAYGTFTMQWQHLQAAYLINPRAALMSASWGLFQIMGENFQAAGYGEVENFVTAMCNSEQEQLNAFVKFIPTTHALSALQKPDWTAFAYAYNGPKYKDNNYATSIEKNYEGLKRENLTK